MTTANFIPGLLTLPIAALAMVLVAAHLLIIERRAGNYIRRRIRMANGWIMLISIPLIAAGFSFIDPNARPRMFVIVWMTIFGLVAISIMLAFADIINTGAIARRTLFELRQSRRNIERLFERARDTAPQPSGRDSVHTRESVSPRQEPTDAG